MILKTMIGEDEVEFIILVHSFKNNEGIPRDQISTSITVISCHLSCHW